MHVLVTVKHMGIKKMLLPVLNCIEGIKFDVFLQDLSGLTADDDIRNLKLIISDKFKKIGYPEGTLKQSFESVDIKLNSYDAYIPAGGCNIAKLINEVNFPKRIYIYTVAPFYRYMIDLNAIKNMYRNTLLSNVMVIHSTPYHINEFKKKAEFDYFKNNVMLPHGLNTAAWPKWKGDKNSIVTIWGGFNKRIINKSADNTFGRIKGKELVNQLTKGNNFTNLEGLTEEQLRNSLQKYKCHLFFMKDHHTIGLVENMRVGIPTVCPNYGHSDPNYFITNGENGFFSDKSYLLKMAIDEIMCNKEYANKLSKGAQETCDEVFNFHRYIENWERLLHGILFHGFELNQPYCYKRYKYGS